MSRSFLENNHELARQFMAITDRLNRQYDTAPGPMESAIAQGAGLRVAVANRLLQKFSFPSAREQISGQWLGDGGVIKNDLPELAAFLALHGDLDKPLSSYGEFFDTGLLE
jgi:ABC-type taurine transport system substrate-binding protein